MKIFYSDNVYYVPFIFRLKYFALVIQLYGGLGPLRFWVTAAYFYFICYGGEEQYTILALVILFFMDHNIFLDEICNFESVTINVAFSGNIFYDV